MLSTATESRGLTAETPCLYAIGDQRHRWHELSIKKRRGKFRAQMRIEVGKGLEDSKEDSVGG